MEVRYGMGQHSGGARTFFGRLAADRRGNTLAIAAAALLPMMALIGGGVDVSRAYMAKTQLQSACDAGVPSPTPSMRAPPSATPNRSRSSGFKVRFSELTVTPRKPRFTRPPAMS